MLPILMLLVLSFAIARVNAARFSAVDVGVMLPILLPLVSALRRPNFLLVFGADADVYAADRPGLCPFISLLWDEYVSYYL